MSQGGAGIGVPVRCCTECNIIPVSVDEIGRPGCLETLKYLDLILPIGCSGLVTKMCLIGHSESGNHVPFWDIMDIGSLGYRWACLPFRACYLTAQEINVVAIRHFVMARTYSLCDQELW